MELNKVERSKFGFVQETVTVGQGRQTTLALWRQCNDVRMYEISSQKILLFSEQEGLTV